MVKNRDRESGVYSIHQAKTQLSRLLDHVLSSGTPILIGRRGKAEAMLAPISAKANAKRAPGLYRSIIKFPENTLPESPNISTLSSSQTLLLSPQSLLRWFAAPFELSATVHQFIEEPTNGVCVSVDALRQILVWVNENKIDLGTLKGRLAAACTSQGIEVLGLEPNVIEKAASLNGNIDAALAVLNDFMCG